MKCAIMQPTYLPWAGYFHLIAEVDIFCFLDDVQFARRSWQQRNRILLNHTVKYLTIPTLSKGNRDQLINEVFTNESKNWRNQHKKTLYHGYAKHPYSNQILPLLSQCLDQNSQSLAEINIGIITAIKEMLGIPTPLLRTSNIPVYGKRSEYLLKICKNLGVNTYLSAAGSKPYIENEGLFKDIKVEYQEYIPRPYPQINVTRFVPYLSIVDMIANIGLKETLNHIL